MERKVYTPDSNIRNPWLMMRDIFADIKLGRDLALRLTIRDIKAQYRQSILGLVWAFIIPIANTMVWILLNSSGIVSMDDTSIPYPIYVFSGTMIWSIFLESMQSPLVKVTTNKSMIGKVNFPREALLMSAFYQSLFNACIKALILVVALAFMGYFGGLSLLFFPFALFAMVVTGIALGMLLIPIGSLYTDISKGLPLIMQFLMYTTPVIYAIPKEGLARSIVVYNPLTPLVMVSRDFLTGQATEFLVPFFWVLGGAAVVLSFGLVAYRLAMPILVERMNA